MKDYLKKVNIRWTIFGLLLSGVIISCKPANNAKYGMLNGETWGTYYRITLESENTEANHEVIKEILKSFDNVLSTYVPNSIISNFNKSEHGQQLTKLQDRYFQPVYKRSIELNNSTEGYLDVTVMPLLNYWGFGYKAVRRAIADVDSLKVKELVSIVDISKVGRVEAGSIVKYTKTHPEIEIDFSALAKGYGIDIIAEYLEEIGVKNYLIDIGGEARSKGVNVKGKPWTLAINKPYAEADYTTQELVLELAGKSIATSGNYREMYEVDGIVFGHILNPITGYPQPSDILSATIIADDCMTADGLATACVAAGMVESKRILANHPNVSACLIYDADGDEKLEKEYIAGFEKYVLIEN